MLDHVNIEDLTKPFDKAIQRQRRIMLCDHSANAMNTMAALLQVNGDYTGSMQWIERTLQRYPFDGTAKYLKSLALLVDGNYTEGFRLYEYRFATYPGRGKINKLCQPWCGEATDRVVYIWQDGGIGDAIMFVRYFPQVLKRAPNAVLLVDPGLIDLFAESGVAPIARMPRSRDDFDKHFTDKLGCAIQSLPHVLGISRESIDGAPYLRAPVRAVDWWANKMINRPRIGFCWRGNPLHERDVTRSIPNELIQGFGERHDILSLTKEHLNNVADWCDTAGIIANLDVVISVDTAIAHLAGAMGKQIWILLPYDFDWRWMAHKARTHWYKSARLFRCFDHGEWMMLLNDVSKALVYHDNSR